MEQTLMLLVPLPVLLVGLALLFKAGKSFDKQLFVRTESFEKTREYCNVLGIDGTATIGDVKRAFKEKSKILHPNNKETGDREKFEQLKLAYETLVYGGPYGTSRNDISEKMKNRNK